MSIGQYFFKKFAQMGPRVRGFTNSHYFAHPFLDAWFAWFPQNNVSLDGAALGEIYNVAARIKEGVSYQSWIDEWEKEGDRLRISALKIEQQGHRISAGEAYLRAFTYYRTAHLATAPVETTRDQMFSTYKNLVECYQKFIELSNVTIERVKVPFIHSADFNKSKLNGYFYKAAENQEKSPTVIWLSGAESIAEDGYWWAGAAGMKRGFNVLSIDLPGDTATRILNPEIIMNGRGDDAYLSIMDYLLKRPDIDPDNIYVYGISMGGFRSTRFAQIDNRLKGVVANAPMLNAGDVLEKAKYVYKIGGGAAEWGERMCWQYGISTDNGLKQGMIDLVDGKWNSLRSEPENITVPFYTVAGENELGGEGIRQALEFHDRLSSEKKMKRITTFAEGAETHCQLNNFPLSQQIVFDWIEDLMRGNI